MPAHTRAAHLHQNRIEPSEFEGERCDDKQQPDGAMDPEVQPVGNDAYEPLALPGARFGTGTRDIVCLPSTEPYPPH
jgi:hypothetical protein